MKLRHLALAFCLLSAACSSSEDPEAAAPGADGASGAQGLQGAEGADGADGRDGLDGAPGPQGEQGPAGDVGPAGPAGPQGPSGVVKVLSFDGKPEKIVLPGNSGNTDYYPVGCWTEAKYVAGPDEVAVVAMDATATPQNAASDVLYLGVGVSVDGAQFKRGLFGPQSAESMADGTASTSIHHVVPLVAGSSYRFAAALASNGQVTLGTTHCHGTVLIVRQ